MKKKIYVCSPFKGDTLNNFRKAVSHCRFVKENGYLPVAPHIYFPLFSDDENEEDRQMGLQAGLKRLEECNELWVFGTTVSDGMKAEIERAAELGLRILFFTETHFIAETPASKGIINLLKKGVNI